MSGRALRQQLRWIRDLDNILRDWLTRLKLERDRTRSMLDRVKARHARKHHEGGEGLPQGVDAVNYLED